MKKLFVLLLCTYFLNQLQAQLVSACGSIDSRNNSNGQANNCAGGATPIASNFINTIYATVPASAKTADITFKYVNTNYLTLKPFAITKISQTVNGVTTVLDSPVGPAGVPTLTGSNDALVKYCVYKTNISTTGTLKFELTDPETGIIYGSCFYEAACSGNCIPSSIVLPIVLNSLTAKKTTTGVLLEWRSFNEVNTEKYFVEKSRDGRQFTELTHRSATGNNTAAYSVTDFNPAMAVNYYRIKLLKIDGSFEYSNIVQIKFQTEKVTVTNVQPTVFINALTIDVDAATAEPVFIKLYNVQGKLIRNKSSLLAAGKNTILLDKLSSLHKGIYTLHISSGAYSWRTKVIR